MNEKDNVEEIFIEEINDDVFNVPRSRAIVGTLLVAFILIVFGTLSLIALLCKVKAIIIIMIISNVLGILFGIFGLSIVIDDLWNNKHYY